MEYAKKNKYKIAAIAFVIILLSMFSRPALAYYVLQGTSKNIVTTGDIDISIVETLDGMVHSGNVNISPGGTVNKALYIQNVGGHPCWLRIKLDKTRNIEDKDVISLNIDSQNWLYKDGYYYYKTILASGATSSALYDQVTIIGDGSETQDRYSGTYVSMSITAEAIQSENNQAVTGILTEEDVPQVWPEGVDIIPKKGAK